MSIGKCSLAVPAYAASAAVILALCAVARAEPPEIEPATASLETASPMLSPKGDLLKFRPGCWIPLTVLFSNDGRGEIESDVVFGILDDQGQSRGEFLVRARMPSSSRKAISALAMANASDETIAVSCSDRTVAIAKKRIRLEALAPGVPAALLLSRDAGARSFFADEGLWGGPVEIFTCDPQLLPDAPDGLEPIDWVLLPDDCALDADRARALYEWVLRGGCVLFWSGAGRGAGAASLFIELGDPAFETIERPATESDAAEMIRVRVLPREEGAVLASAGGFPLAVGAGLGSGLVVYVAADVSRPPVRGLAELPGALARSLAFERRLQSGVFHRQAASEIEKVRVPLQVWRLVLAFAMFAAIVGPPGLFLARRILPWKAAIAAYVSAAILACAAAATAGPAIMRAESAEAIFTITHCRAGGTQALIETFGFSASGTVSDLRVSGQAGEAVGPAFTGREKSPFFRCRSGSDPALEAPRLPAGCVLAWRRLSRGDFHAPLGRLERKSEGGMSGSLGDPKADFPEAFALVFGHRKTSMESMRTDSGNRLFPKGYESELHFGYVWETKLHGDYAGEMGKSFFRLDPDSGILLLHASLVSRKRDGSDGMILCGCEIETGPDYYRIPPGYLERRWLDSEGKQLSPAIGPAHGPDLMPGESALLEAFVPVLPSADQSIKFNAGTSYTSLTTKVDVMSFSLPSTEWYIWDEGRFGRVEDDSRLMGEGGRVLARFTNTINVPVRLFRPWIEAEIWERK